MQKVIRLNLIYNILFYLLIFTIILLPHIFVQLGSQGIIGGDGYYHIRYAQLLRLAFPTLSIPFPYLPLTILNPLNFTDHHLLFHILLMPFTFGDLIIGAKIAAVLFAGMATITWFLIAKAESVKFPFFWLLTLFASSSDFLYRLSMTRRQSLVLLLLLLAVHLILTRRLKWLVVLGFAFAWLYDGWIMLVAVSLIASFGVWVEQKRIYLKLFLAPCFGILLGTIINPFFPHNIIFSIQHLLPKINQDVYLVLRFIASKIHNPLKILFDNNPIPIIHVGGEWYPPTTDDLVQTAGFALIMLVLSFLVNLFLFIGEGKKPNAQQIAWGGCTFLLTVLFLLSARFAEYQPAFAIMFAAVSFSVLIQTRIAKRIYANFRNLLYPVEAALLIVVLAVGLLNLHDAKKNVIGDDLPEKYAGASHFLETNSPPGSLIFINSWDEFPLLFFHNTKNTYLGGLDPYYQYQYNPKLYFSWEDIVMGQVENPSETISSLFKSNWIFIDDKSLKFLDQAQKDSHMRQVYQDKWATIFKIDYPKN